MHLTKYESVKIKKDVYFLYKSYTQYKQGGKATPKLSSDRLGLKRVTSMQSTKSKSAFTRSKLTTAQTNRLNMDFRIHDVNTH